MVNLAPRCCQIYDFICDFLLRNADISGAVCNFPIIRLSSKYSRVSVLLFLQSYPLIFFFVYNHFLLPNSFSYEFLKVRFGYKVETNLTIPIKNWDYEKINLAGIWFA